MLPKDDGEEFTLSVPEAGAMANLGRNASYRAANRGEIPTIRLGGKRRVPATRWRRILTEGLEMSATPDFDIRKPLRRG
jgi:hypothetical protein